MAAQEQWVQLEPFVHQVGGHCSMLKFDETSVCKPLVQREYRFYQSLPKDLREFTPQYKGIVEVSFIEEDDGYMTVVGYPVEIKQGKHKKKQHTSNSPESGEDGARSDSDSDIPAVRSSQSIRIRKSGSLEVQSGSHLSVVRKGSSADSGFAEVNPWIQTCYKRSIAKLKKQEQDLAPQKFLLLENIASDFVLPCVLDLKMGTRQHGDDASDAKKSSHMQRCASTTSSTLGLRICGMQVYQASNQQYLCQDKYHGRQLTVDGVLKTLYQFLHNGQEFRCELLDPIMDRLQQLHDIISRHQTFRFYSSSLLIMYEGAPDGSTIPTDCLSNGVHKLAPMVVDHVSNSCDTNRNGHVSTHSGTVSTAGLKPRADSAPCQPRDRTSVISMHPSHTKHKHLPVDVRMIDFAHSTHQGFSEDKTVHVGPDRGYLFGLQHLIRLLKELKTRHCHE